MKNVKLLGILMLGNKVYGEGSVVEVTPQHAQELVNKGLAIDTSELVNEVLIDEKKPAKPKKPTKKPSTLDLAKEGSEEGEEGQPNEKG